MIADLIMTTFRRPRLLRRSLESLWKCKDRDLYRLTVVHDAYDPETRGVLIDYGSVVDHVICHSVNEGLGPSLNQGLAHVDALKKWDTDPVPLTCYIQDDVLFAEHWLEKLSSKYIQLYHPLKLAFASGHQAMEHKDDPRADPREIMPGILTNKYIRATCMLAYHSVWMSMWPIPRVDPETGRERGRPHDGLGSGVDWHFVRVHPNSVVKSGRTNLIMPGLTPHAGYAESTWLKRELPESAEDKKLVTIVDPNDCTCSYGESEEMTRHAPLCKLGGE